MRTMTSSLRGLNDVSPRSLSRSLAIPAHLAPEPLGSFRCLMIMAKQSAGLIMYRIREGNLQVLLVHPGGPFWARKDLGAWSIPKGEYDENEQPLDAAIREFNEETGFDAHGPFLDLGSVKQAGGKIVTAWAFEGDCDPATITSNLCRMEWPPRSGRQIEFREVDRARWFTIQDAAEYILKGQAPLLQVLTNAINTLI
jgi:predicted NUDIX family NTP pyrophosphohydrolase